jgi:type I restriction enzyme S subunit
MIDGLKPYPAMKNSGVAWLGQVPAHWEVRRLKGLCSRFAIYGANASAESYTRTGVRFLRTTDITEDGNLKGGGVRLRKELVPEYLLSHGDLLISRSGTIGRSFLYDERKHEPCAYAGYLVRFVPSVEVLSKFLFLFTRTVAFADFLRVMAISSTIENVNGEKLANCPLPFPPPSEQSAIVRFLDHADRRIQRYLRVKEKLVALLEEQKQAIIHEAVTGRIDVRTGKPYPAYKDSGVEWLGNVPEHWEVRRLKTLCSMKSGKAITGMSIGPEGEYPVYGGNGVRGFASQYTHDGQYVLIGRQGALCGNIHVACDKFWASEHAVVATLHAGHALRWFSAILDVMDLNQYSIAAAQPGLAVERVLNLWLPVPNPAEQAAIAMNIEQRFSSEEAAIACARREIDLLREYRTRLIADVVTGKLDVRDAEATLSEDLDAVEGSCFEPQGNDVDPPDRIQPMETPAIPEEMAS